MTKTEAEQLLYRLQNDRPRPIRTPEAIALVQEILDLHQQLEALTP